MKHLVYIGSKESSVNTEIPYTHAVIGQRDRSKDEVPDPKPLGAMATPQERAKYDEDLQKRKAFVFADTRGRYSMKVLDWAISEEEADTKAAALTKAGWLKVRVIPVHTTLENA